MTASWSFSRFFFAARYWDVQFVPISALKGDNVVERSNRMPWYEGSTLCIIWKTSTSAATSAMSIAGSRFNMSSDLNGMIFMTTGVMPVGWRLVFSGKETV